MEEKKILYQIFWEELNKRIGNVMYTTPKSIVDKVAIFLNHCKVTHKELENGRFNIYIEKNDEKLMIEIIPKVLENGTRQYYVVSDIKINL